MISRDSIEKVLNIIDRELAFIDLRPMNRNRKQMIMDNWLYVRDTFKTVCIDCAKSEGLLPRSPSAPPLAGKP